ncbi:sporulation integral membrane protein YlbJ [Alkalihalobacillus sp. MEB130]|uniref:sporulation integral membrane protein YlbJ n=1 Tax=Alkalihalobacillus sp. MEB130 TaxID=2976704 RepID=UPI0028DE0AFE|nr:sporulation integral membrane protein YlbJ [Alkalihalobacillus sp. MEB130]MDT8859141.1 sporulation integral membrane protein YlbJ [Alkalihalobacillus sp. MEB130]
MSGSMIKTYTLALISIFLAASLMIFPQQALEGSIRGLNIWWEVVFPSLLPFFIVSELLIGFGVVTFLGVLLEPLMRPLFRVPGVGGFVWAMGLASGNPAGAKITARLRQQKKLSRIEAERLVSFTSSANPLFIFGAIAVGFFHNAALGIVLALAHYLGNIFVGLIMRFYGRKEEASSPPHKPKASGLVSALNVLHEERIKDGRPIGKLLGDAVQSSVRTLLMIGGFIILFSVLNKIFSLVGIVAIIGSFFSIILAFFHLPSDLSPSLVSGIFEMTLGAQIASETTSVGLLEQVIVASFILAFSGFSIQAQVASILAETDIRFKPFLISRFIHGFFAAFLVFLFWKPFYLNQQTSGEQWQAIPVFLREQSSTWVQSTWSIISDYGSLFTLIMLIIFIFITAKNALAHGK